MISSFHLRDVPNGIVFRFYYADFVSDSLFVRIEDQGDDVFLVESVETKHRHLEVGSARICQFMEAAP